MRKPGGAELTLFPTTVILPAPLLSQYGLAAISSEPHCVYVFLLFGNVARNSSDTDNGKISANFILFFDNVVSYNVRAGQNFLGPRKGASVAWSCASCSTSKTRCIQCMWEGLTEAFIVEYVR